MPNLGDLGENVGEVVVDVSCDHADDVGVHDGAVGEVVEEEKSYGEVRCRHADEEELDVDVGVFAAPDVDDHGVQRHAEKAGRRVDAGNGLERLKLFRKIIQRSK